MKPGFKSLRMTRIIYAMLPSLARNRTRHGKRLDTVPGGLVFTCTELYK